MGTRSFVVSSIIGGEGWGGGSRERCGVTFGADASY